MQDVLFQPKFLDELSMNSYAQVWGTAELDGHIVADDQVAKLAGMYLMHHMAENCERFMYLMGGPWSGYFRIVSTKLRDKFALFFQHHLAVWKHTLGLVGPFPALYYTMKRRCLCLQQPNDK